MIEEHGSRWREERLLEDKAKGWALVGGLMFLSVIIALITLGWGSSDASAERAFKILIGIVAALIAVSKPDIMLLVVTVLAPLWVYMVRVGSVLPGTGITPVNGLMFVMVLGAAIQRYTNKPPAAEATEIDKPLLLFLGWSAFSIVTGTLFWHFDPNGIGEWLQLAAGYSTYWVVRRRWHSRRLAIFAVWLVMAMVVYQSVVVLNQYRAENTAQFSWDLKGHIVGTFGRGATGDSSLPAGNSNDTGMYLAAYGLVALGLFMAMRKSLWRWPALAVFAIASAGTFVTYSRAAQLGLLGGMLVMVLYKRKRLLLPMLAMMALLPSVLPGSIGERFTTASDASSESRKELWKRAALVTLKNPIFGVGWRAYSKSQEYQGYRLRDPHNMYLLVSAEQGLPGLAMYLGMLIGIGTVTTRILRQRHAPMTEGLALGLFGALICFAMNNVFGSRMVYIYVVQHFFLLLGLLVVMAYAPRGEGAAEVVEEEPEPERSRQPSPWRYHDYV